MYFDFTVNLKMMTVNGATYCEQMALYDLPMRTKAGQCLHSMIAENEDKRSISKKILFVTIRAVTFDYGMILTMCA